MTNLQRETTIGRMGKPQLPPFARRLVALLERAGLTGYELAKRSGVSKQTVSNLLRGRKQPSWKTVQALARGLDVTTELLRDDGPPSE